MDRHSVLGSCGAVAIVTINGRTKGNAAEREVADLLQAWWSQVDPNCKFCRTPQSGGWSSPTVRSEFRTSGDVITTSQTFPFSVEVKRRESWEWKPFKLGMRSPVWSWWRQALLQADEMNAHPLLWFRKSRESWHVLVTSKVAVQIEVPAVCAWTRPKLYKVNYGGVLPVCYRAQDILKVSPNTFLQARKP